MSNVIDLEEFRAEQRLTEALEAWRTANPADTDGPGDNWLAFYVQFGRAPKDAYETVGLRRVNGRLERI